MPERALGALPKAHLHIHLPALLKAGVPCDLVSDDPLLFGPNLLDEFVLCREKMGLSDEQLAAMARTSFEYSGAPQAVKARYCRGRSMAYCEPCHLSPTQPTIVTVPVCQDHGANDAGLTASMLAETR